MKHPARIQTCIELLGRINASPIPMDNTIRDYMAPRRYIGSKDRTAVVERVYGIVRAHARLGWHISQDPEVTDNPRIRILADMILREGLSLRDLDEVFSGDKHAPDPMDAEEKAFAARLKGTVLDAPDMPETVRAECPEQHAERLRTLFGPENFADQMRAMMKPAPLDLRVNTLKGTVEEAQSWLAAQGVETDTTSYSPIGLRVRGKAFMTATKAYSKGLVEIQDEGSQLIALLCGVKPGMRVLDYCAGAGGKTLALAALMKGSGNIVAADIDARRLEKGRRRYRKAGAHNVEIRCLADEKNRKWLRRQKGTMDCVLVDAPCTSSGTWRRNPDLRWRQYGPSEEEIRTMQADILNQAAERVKPGGRLVYATCSLFPEENEDQVERFLQEHTDFERLPLDAAWPDDVKTPPPPCPGPYLRLFPQDHETDGFFAAALLRKAA